MTIPSAVILSPFLQAGAVVRHPLRRLRTLGGRNHALRLLIREPFLCLALVLTGVLSRKCCRIVISFRFCLFNAAYCMVLAGKQFLGHGELSESIHTVVSRQALRMI